MVLFYRFGLFLYTFSIKIASLFNQKAKYWINGRKNIWQKIAAFQNQNQSKVIWFHVSSLGEFEQGRPLIEKLKDLYPSLKIVLTFFSPSGYEIRKSYASADVVFYLPIDNPTNAKRFYELIKPNLVVFVKYDFWYYYIREAHKRNIPIILISAVFQPSQIFFKWYGAFFRNILKNFNNIFVQDEKSEKLLKQIGIHSEVAGDTRCDRVIQIAQNPLPLNEVRAFVQNRFTIVVGSMWNEDMLILKNTINSSPDDILWIIAPHNIEDAYISLLEKQIIKPTLRYSKLQESKDSQFQVLFVDNIGKLSSLYQFAKIAYIGGGFGKGIHNTLEPAAYGVPVIFGPKYQKFNEAIDMINEGAAFSIKNKKECSKIFSTLIYNETFRNKSSQIAYRYI
ncbi:MAG: 3-deoxy-D-manno-octulosonic acid transferase, partial [Bacteroidales bacterium]